MPEPAPGAPPPHFIVLVPGYMGSRLRSRSTGEMVWLDLPSLLKDPFEIPQAIQGLFAQMHYPNDDLEPDGIIDQIVFLPPLFKQQHYGRLLEALARWGYSLPGGAPLPGKPRVYTFAYDWRQDNRLSAQQLAQAVQGWRAENPGARAWLIGHSNGGIVSRWYIEKEGGKEHVERLFLMGSPWDGAPKSLQVLLKGMDMFLVRLLSASVDIPALTRQLMLSFPSFYQLVPNYFPFLRDENDQPIDPYSDMSWLETGAQRQMLQDARQFNMDLGTTLSVDSLCFFGVKQPTTTSGVRHLEPGGEWQITWDQTEAGDGTVPQRSAIHPQAREKLPYAAGHGDIYVVPPVLEKLEFELVSKYGLGVLAALVTERLAIQFEPQGEVFAPGEAIPVWASLRQRQSGAPVFGAQVSVQAVLSQALPGSDSETSEPSPEIQMEASLRVAGRYEGELIAPQTPGYYRLVARVTVPGENPVELEELVLVEAAPEL
ncbi:MAG: hypothetical protein AB1894_18555 [Chloroflexota bacterium]